MFKPTQYRLHLSILVGEVSGTVMDWACFFCLYCSHYHSETVPSVSHHFASLCWETWSRGKSGLNLNLGKSRIKRCIVQENKFWNTKSWRLWFTWATCSKVMFSSDSASTSNRKSCFYFGGMRRVLSAMLCSAISVNPAPFSGSRELPHSLERSTRVTAMSETRFRELDSGAQYSKTQKRRNHRGFR